jgi:heat shock protein HslJ
MKLHYMAGILVAGLFLSSCKTNSNQSSSKAKSEISPDTQKDETKENTMGINRSYAIKGTKWKLTELMGQPVNVKEKNKQGFLLLMPDGRFSASAGCNTFNGSYTLEEGMRLSFAENMAATLMACPGREEVEEQFKKMLLQVNNYAITGDVLSLHMNKMAPLARFQAE